MTEVWLPEYQRYATIIQRNAYYVVVRWTDEGQVFELEMTNDEFDEINNDDD